MKVIELKNVSKTFNLTLKDSGIKGLIKSIFNVSKKKTLKALDNISFEMEEGEIFGIIGANGSGKSTLLNLIIGNYKPDKGSEITVNGKIIRLALGLGVDPNLSGRENIYVNGSVIGLTFKEISKIYNHIIEFAELQGFENTPVKFYSKGMRNRLLFSIAVNANADIFLLDEFFGGVGDEVFQKKSNKVFEENITNKKTIIIVSHQTQLIKKHCKKVLWLHKGKMVMLGESSKVIDSYLESVRNKHKNGRRK